MVLRFFGPSAFYPVARFDFSRDLKLFLAYDHRVEYRVCAARGEKWSGKWSLEAPE